MWLFRGVGGEEKIEKRRSAMVIVRAIYSKRLCSSLIRRFAYSSLRLFVAYKCPSQATPVNTIYHLLRMRQLRKCDIFTKSITSCVWM